MGSDADARARAGVEAIFTRYHKLAEQKSGDLYDYDCMTRTELLSVSAEKREVVYKFTPSPRYANLNNVVHGAAFGVLFDMFTMTALGTVSKLNYWEFMGGVSRTLNTSFLRAVPIGTPLWFRCRVVQHGRTMAFMKGEATDESGKTVYATVEHHKVHLPPLKEHKELRISYDDFIEQEAMQGKAGAKL